MSMNTRDDEAKAHEGAVLTTRTPECIKSHSQQRPKTGTMAQNMAHECSDRVASGGMAVLAKVELTPNVSRACQDANCVEISLGQRYDMRLARPAGFTEHSTARKPERHLSPLRSVVTAALSALVERRHYTQLTQARQLEPKHALRAQSSFAQMPQGNPCRVEQLGVRVVEIGQIGQQFGDVIAGIQ